MHWVQEANNLINCIRKVGRGVSAQRLLGGMLGALCCVPGGVISLHNEVSAFLTQRVIMELALIMTFPSVAAIDHRDA